MESNNNKIKKLMLNNQNPVLPPELNWEDMKDGIFSKMDSIEKDNLSIQKKKKSKRRFIFFIFLVFSVCLGIFNILNRINNEKIEEAKVVLQEFQSNENKATSIPSGSPINPSLTVFCPESDENHKSDEHHGKQSNTDGPSGQYNLSAVSASAGNQKIQGLNGVNSEIESAISKQPDTKTKRLKTAQKPIFTDQNESRSYFNLQSDLLPKSNNSSSDIFIQADQNKIITNEEVSGFDASSTHLSEMVEKQSSSQVGSETSEHEDYTPKLNTLSHFVVSQFPFNYETIKPSTQNMGDSIGSSYKLNNLSDQLILEGGISFWNREYGSNKPENAEYEKTLLSLQVQCYYVKQLKKGYFVMAGIQYQQLESKFQHNLKLQNYSITLKDTIIHVLNNSLTGNHSTVRGDVEVPVAAERRIIHFNTSRLLKTSLALGRSWRFHSWQADFYLGGGINVLAHNEGRTLYQGNILDYNGTSNGLFQNIWNYDAIAGGRIQYFVHKNLGITAGFQYQKSLVNWSREQEINSFPSLFGLQIGLSYSWK